MNPSAPQRALERVSALARRIAVSPGQEAALLRQLGGDHARGPVTSLCARLPALAFQAAGGAGEIPHAVVTGCVAIYLGADLLDEVEDRELPPEWHDAGPDQATLASICLMYPLALAAFGEVEGAEVRLALVDALVPVLLEMAEGQALDLAFERRDDVTRVQCADVVSRKSSQLGFYTRAGAITARASADVERAMESIGRNLGTCLQLHSDVAEVLAPAGEGKDLRRGKRTLPVVHALTALDGERRDQLVRDLAAAAGDPAAEDAARTGIVAAGSVIYTAIVAETHRQRALSALRPIDPAGRSELAALLADLSPLRSRGAGTAAEDRR